MIKNEDKKLVPKGAEREQELNVEGLIFKATAKKTIRTIPIQLTDGEGDAPEYIPRGKVLEAIDKLPAEKIKSPEQIEKAIKKLDEIPTYPTPIYTMQDITDFGRWILGQEQKEKGLHWTDEELLG